MAARLEGKVALVTGAGRGIGRAIACKLASDGARVVVNDMDEAPLAETLELVRAAGSDGTAVPGSVTEAGFADRFVAAALDAHGGLDIIVNNAGFTWDSVIQKMTDEQFAAVMDVHVTAPFRILRAAAEPIRRMAKEEAAAGREVFRKVVNISSVSGLGGNAGQVNYATAKAGIVGMTKTLAKEWGRYKVNVNCVAFGFIQTRMTQALDATSAPVQVAGREIRYGVQPAMIEALETNQIPLGRLGTVEDAANGVWLFCTPESDYISGQVITVGGGITF
ncbi:MAG: SDR family oxidoreductase [Cytophagaceae bacterium]|nr:SDR family oxidoreductase [Gemmatimonadaceae bacterium]